SRDLPFIVRNQVSGAARPGRRGLRRGWRQGAAAAPGRKGLILAETAAEPVPQALDSTPPQGVGAAPANSRAMASGPGCVTTPRSVTMASIRPAGVTSKTGFQACTPSATVRVPDTDSSS